MHYCPDRVEQNLKTLTVSRYVVWINRAVKQGIYLVRVIAENADQINLATWMFDVWCLRERLQNGYFRRKFFENVIASSYSCSKCSLLHK